MARVTSLLELALVRIAVAIGAVSEWQSRVTRLAIRARRVAALAKHIAMLARQRELRP